MRYTSFNSIIRALTHEWFNVLRQYIVSNTVLIETIVNSFTSQVDDQYLSVDQAYNILSDRRRRYAIHHLKQVDSPVSVQDLAEQVAAWENDKKIEQLDAQERKRVYISLYQSHLSTLDDQGIVDYNKDTGMVVLTQAADSIDIYLEVVSKTDIPWSVFYIGLTIAFAVLVVITYTGVGILNRSQLLIVTVGILIAYATAGIVQTVQQKRMKLGDSGPPPELR